MPSVATFPAPSPFERVVDVRVWPHGFTTQQADTAAGPAGSAIVRPNIESAAWHAATAQKWGGNIVWTGSTVKHTVAYNGPRGRYFGTLTAGSFVAFSTWFSHNGAKVDGPSGRVLGACVKVYDSLPTHQTYVGTGTGTLTMQDPSTTVGALTGDYTVRCITAGATPRFVVTGPDAQPVGVAEAGPFAGAAVLFDGVLRFTLQSGAVAFVVGDQWTVTVEEAEQFVCIVVEFIDSTPRTETVWRRGVSLSPASPWRQIGSIAPVSGQVDGSIQPWFFNASATLAVTCRGLGEDAGGFTLGTVGRSLSLATLTVTDSVHYGGKITYTTTLTTTATTPNSSPPPAEYATAKTVVNATATGGPFEQLMAQDFVGDALLTLSLRLSGSCDGTADFSYVTSEPKDVALNGGYSAEVTLVSSGGGAADLILFSLSASGSRTRTYSTTPSVASSTRSITFLHRSLLDIADPAGAPAAWTQYEGVNSVDEDSTAGVYSESASAVTLSHLVAGSTVADVTGGSGPAEISFPFPDSTWVEVTSDVNDSVENDTTSADFAGLRGLSGAWLLRINASQGVVPSDPILAGAGLPAANTTTGKGLQTSAQDTRGNWLMAAEIASFGTADMSWPGSIGASGTYTLQAGGPDALTPSQVHTLTGHPGADLWNIGAF